MARGCAATRGAVSACEDVLFSSGLLSRGPGRGRAGSCRPLPPQLGPRSSNDVSAGAGAEAGVAGAAPVAAVTVDGAALADPAPGSAQALRLELAQRLAVQAELVRMRLLHAVLLPRTRPDRLADLYSQRAPSSPARDSRCGPGRPRAPARAGIIAAP